eukprot:CAMPEP_0202710410 /NCGR_PEP_ID=MMETSP1385-20130828/22389_1 /ASSEMBLY_ACC=CAM_ASM_000861 /TAXON_ID=933848 /ORGANISM="Elphidium margaritaceum" /LENGTH=567 /DNA_ID=CAMNT_0049369937 /DNA_START=32 /DNA_END=1735 /DNA_ORIENTATION=-
MTLLGQKLAQLFDTAPDIDPENAFDDDTIAKNRDIDTGIDVDVLPSRMRGIDLGQRYKGQVVSRQQLNQWENDDEDQDLDMQQDDDDEDEDVDVASNSGGLRVIPVIESDAEEAAEEEEEVFDTLFEDENESTAGIVPGSLHTLQSSKKHNIDRLKQDQDVRSNSNNSKQGGDMYDFTTLMNQQMDKAQVLQQQEEQHLKVFDDDDDKQRKDKNNKRPQSFQLRKAKAVALQSKMYDKVATLRIHLQKPFQIAQKLPRPSVHAQLFGGEQNEKKRKLKSMLTRVNEKCLHIADDIMHLQSKLLDSNEEYAEEWRYRKRRRLEEALPDAASQEQKQKVVDMDALWSEMKQDWSAFLPHCNQVMEMWDNKMKLVESYSAKKEKAHQQTQTLLERIALIVENPQRILHKMQSVDKLFKMYGDDSVAVAVAVADGDGDGDDGVGEEQQQSMAELDDIHAKDERILAGLGDERYLKFEKYRMEYQVFNDAQFYRKMLKEIIDIGHTSNFDADEIRKKMDQQQEEKQRQKMAFHKAKLRMKFAIRPDMENFMAPIYNHDPEFPVEQLFNSLFQ